MAEANNSNNKIALTINNEALAGNLKNEAKEIQEEMRRSQEAKALMGLREKQTNKRMFLIKIGQSLLTFGVMYLLYRFDVQGMIGRGLWGLLLKLKFW